MGVRGCGVSPALLCVCVGEGDAGVSPALCSLELTIQGL